MTDSSSLKQEEDEDQHHHHNTEDHQNQQRLCDFCGETTALLYCRADSAKLCLSCDKQVHSTNQLFTKHSRTLLCDSCDSTPASILCSTHSSVLCQNCDWETHNQGNNHERRPLEGFTGCPSVSELLTILGFQDLTKKALLCGGDDDYLVGSGYGDFGSDGYSDYLVWDTPSIVSMDDLIASNSSEHSFQAMGVPPLPKNRKAACGQYKEEILSQLREMAKSEPGFSDCQGDIQPFMQFQSLVPEQDLQPGDRYDDFDRGSEQATVPNYKVEAQTSVASFSLFDSPSSFNSSNPSEILLVASMANNAQFPGMQPLRPPIPPGPPQGAPPPMPIQFRTAVPAPQPQVYIPMASQQFQHVGHANVGMPFHSQQFQFSSVQQLPPIPTPEVQANRPPQNAQIASTYVAGLNGPRMLLSSTYTFGPSSGGSLQRNADASVQYQPTPQTNLSSFPGGAQPWLPTGSHSMISVAQNIGDQSSATPSVVPAVTKEPNHIEKLPSDWLEHTSPAGKRYYFNKKTKLSTWEKPLELMTPTERADATTDWKEHMSPEGRKYYYNRVTKQSKWKIPDEVKLAREKMKMALTGGTQAGNDDYPAPTPDAVNPSSFAHGPVSSPNQAATASASVSPKPMATSQPSSSPVAPSMVEENAIPVQTNVETITPNAGLLESTETSNIMLNADVTPMSIVDAKAAQDVVDTVDGVSTGDIEEAENGKGSARNVNVTVLGEKTAVPEPLVYENKLEARNAFKALLESANIGSDWTWDQAMRVIINDQRYGALRTLGERKQAFNEFLVQKKKKDAEERRARQKKAQEDFRKMLEESKDLTSSSRWSKVIAIFEDDERFKAVERAKDREDLFQDYIVELEKKERANALEERKWNRREFLNFLKSCDFITASSQWRKVQDRLEDDERCLRLEKIDRLEIFQEYIRDLEREEEEQMKIRMEELRKAERKNREEFRKLMEEHVASGILTPTTHWRDYCMKVKDLPAYLAVSSNTSGSTAKDLFEDVAEELQKQYMEDKARIKDAMKSRKIALSSTWTLEDFKAALIEDITSQPLSEINLKLVFDELQERVKEKEEKEAKRRKLLADDFYDLLFTSKDLTASSKWEDCKQLLEDRQERFVGEDIFFRNIFDEYIADMKEKEKEKEEERKRRDDKAKRERDVKDREKKEKHGREKRRGYASKYGKDRTHSEDAGKYESYVLEENKKSGKDKKRRHRERGLSYADDLSVGENEKDRSENSHRHSSDRKKSKQRSPSEEHSEIRRKRHKKDHHDGSNRNDDYGELRDREFGEDGEVW